MNLGEIMEAIEGIQDPVDRIVALMDLRKAIQPSRFVAGETGQMTVAA